MLALFRFILAIAFFWALFRFLRALARFMGRSGPAPRPEVHPRRPRGRNLSDGETVIDVDYTEKRTEPRAGERKP